MSASDMRNNIKDKDLMHAKVSCCKKKMSRIMHLNKKRDFSAFALNLQAINAIILRLLMSQVVLLLSRLVFCSSQLYFSGFISVLHVQFLQSPTKPGGIVKFIFRNVLNRKSSQRKS